MKKKNTYYFIIGFIVFVIMCFTFVLYVSSRFINSMHVDAKILEWSVRFILGIGSISVLFWTIISYIHTKKLEYTLDERKEWRNELREVLIRLRTLDEKKDDEKTNEYNKCKAIILSNLNPFPSRGSIDNIVLNSFNKNQESLPAQIIALESLLKYYWERAKLETRILNFKLKSIEKKLVNKLDKHPNL